MHISGSSPSFAILHFGTRREKKKPTNNNNQNSNNNNIVNTTSNNTKENCWKCTESTSISKLLNERMGSLEALTEKLHKTTKSLASISKQKKNASSMKFANLDFSKMKLEELQKLVVATTNFMIPSEKCKPDNDEDQSPPPPPTGGLGGGGVVV